MIDSQQLDSFEELKSKLNELIDILDRDKLETRLQSLQDISTSTEFWDNPDKANKVLKEMKGINKLLDKIKGLITQRDDLSTIIEILNEEDDPEFAREFNNKLSRFRNRIEDLEMATYLNEPEDKSSAILTIHPGAGGTESCDWADMLLRMYSRWAEVNDYKITITDLLPGDEAGIKNVDLLIEGEYAFGYLKSEIGIHRLVRISPFDSNSRRHTSFASVYVLPEIEDDIEVEMNEKELRIDTYRSSSAGGQHVNVTDSAVRITHIPTGIVAQCQNERSQHQNKAVALKILKSRLYNHFKKIQEEELKKKQAEKAEIGWGNQIRSYVFHPYSMVKDHRTNCETGNVNAVLDGDIDRFIHAYLKWISKS